MPASDPRAAGWSAAHHGLDPRSVPGLGRWLRAVWWVAGPLVRVRTPPLVITLLGALTALGAVVVGPWFALLLVLISVMLDALDGAVAVLGSQVSASGAVADRVADRVADCAFAAVIWRCGAPWPLALAAAASTLLLEGWRELGRGRLLTTITVAERPSRTVCTVLACLCAGVSPAIWPPTVCAAVWTGLGLAAVAHFAVINRPARSNID